MPATKLHPSRQRSDSVKPMMRTDLEAVQFGEFVAVGPRFRHAADVRDVRLESGGAVVGARAPRKRGEGPAERGRRRVGVVRLARRLRDGN